MTENRIRRMPVVNDDRKPVGIVSLGDPAVHESSRAGGEALAAISR
ncbi:MAG: CBS domain-containing protein [Alphaproteobacteria bacterium]